MASQQTIQNEVTISGTGLMLGELVNLAFKPASVDHGIVFHRTDLPDEPIVQVCPDNYEAIIPRCTSLRAGAAAVNSVEHLLSALAGMGVDNLRVDIDAPECPALDGSALPYVEILQQAEIVAQDAPRSPIELKDPFAAYDEDKQLILLPADSFQISFVYDHPKLPTQVATLAIDPETYVSEIAPARSFCFADEIELLRSQGIGKGASYDNVLVIEDDGSTSSELRFPNEVVRHKMLDLIGDLYLVGKLPQAQAVALKSGHTLHAQLILAMAEEGLIQQQQPIEIMDILEVLPHRYPMCMLDRIIQAEPGKRAVGIKNLSFNEPFFQGHFPEQPVMPGVLQMEALAQLGAWLLLKELGAEGQVGYFVSIKEAKFRRPVVPGDQLRLEIEILRRRRTWARLGGKAYVGDQLAAEGELSIALGQESAG
ncbi:UDP-3-O-[3-hydroxymyristoyl] N-acetylglucosamine deacetylase [Candidatus Poribacteria bacterium]|nr:UDP-3-O-[3-hydroxymyristoyl] N-acetylglucosamine deacetylase [Candidatus Poribacteria bacterium]